MVRAGRHGEVRYFLSRVGSSDWRVEVNIERLFAIRVVKMFVISLLAAGVCWNDMFALRVR